MAAVAPAVRAARAGRVRALAPAPWVAERACPAVAAWARARARAQGVAVAVTRRVRATTPRPERLERRAPEQRAVPVAVAEPAEPAERAAQRAARQRAGPVRAAPR